MLANFLLTLLLVCISATSLAADPDFFSHKNKGAIKGYDTVAYFSLNPGDPAIKGNDEYTYEWRDTVWKFSSAENLKKFVDQPEKYAPQYGGYCTFAVSHGFTTSIRPNSWSIIDDKLYLNHNNTSLKKFSKSPNYYIEKANGNWPTVLTKCEKRSKCRPAFVQ